MIDKKKLVQRLNKGSKLKQLPLLHLAILVIAIVQVIGQGFKIFYLQMLKPIPIILMIIYIHDKNRVRQHLVSRIIEAGLVFSLIGDICLMSNEMSSFLIGTCFFMVGHILYVIAFSLGQKLKTLKKKFRVLRKVGYVIIILALFGNYFTLWDKFPSKIIFLPYCFLLAVETIACMARYEKTVNSSFYFVMIGNILFVISDNLLGYLKFNQIKTDLGRAIIMLTYYGAQFFLMHGALHQSCLIYELNKIQENKKKTY